VKSRGRFSTSSLSVLPESAEQNFREQLIESVHVRVLPKSSLFNDSYTAYDRMGQRGYTHKRVNHARRIYVAGEAHTNAIDGFWSLLRRGILSPPKNSLDVGTGISNPVHVRCVLSPGRVSGSCFRGISPRSYA
jgi:hypothetical protein